MKLEQVYRIGFDKLGSPLVKEATDLFDRTFAEDVRSEYTLAERLRISRALSNTLIGLKLARAGALPEASNTLADVRSSLTGSGKGCRELIESFLLAVDAFIEYQRGHWQNASDRLNAAEQVDIALRERLPILGSHLVQLQHNRMRIMLGCGSVEEAASMAFGLIEDLSGTSKSQPRDSFPLPDEIPRTIRAGLIAQVTQDVATIAYTASNKKLIRALSSIRLNCELSPCLQLNSWRNVISSPPAPGTLNQFLAEGRQAIPALWYDALARAIDTANGSEIKPLVLELSADIEKWIDAPKLYVRKLKEAAT